MGKLLVVTGFSGGGKDTIIEELLSRKKSFRRLVTCADRPPRPGEVHGIHYYFVSSQELDVMYQGRELVEKPLTYGTSRKATPKKEFHKIIYEDASLIWRIESSLAAHVASGAFFDEQFSHEESSVLKKSTVVIFITADEDTLRKRRRKRDGKNYKEEDYSIRDAQDKDILKKHGEHFKHFIVNEDKKFKAAAESILKLLG